MPRLSASLIAPLAGLALVAMSNCVRAEDWSDNSFAFATPDQAANLLGAEDE